MKMHNPGKLRWLGGVSLLALVGTFPAMAQDSDIVETITVTGYRASLESALNLKRASSEMIDAINAEDVAQFPDANLAESLQRLPGVSIDRDNGEGRTITVRGLGADFTRVTLNGMEALSTAGANMSSDTPNRSRQFDFNTFASELFSRLTVRKTPAASTDEGSLGATVELITGHPLDTGNKYALNIQNAWYEYGKAFNPRISALASHTFLGGRLGILGSVAYNMRHQKIDSYQHSPGQSDLVYRGSTFAGTPVTDNGSIVNRAGFAAPEGTSCSGSDGVIPGLTITNSAYCAALSGSDSSAYSTIQGGVRGYTITDGNAKTGKTTSTWTGSGSTLVFPALPNLQQQDVYQTRIGLTGAVQWQIDDSTLITFDTLFSSYYQTSDNYQLSTVGLNRNSTNSSLATATAASNLSSAFASCTEATGSSTAAKVTCSYAKSRSVYDYYTNTASVGYSASDPNGMNRLISFVGRPSTKVLAASATNGVVKYMQLTNVDYSSRNDRAFYTTQFMQENFTVERNFGNTIHTNLALGWSKSHNNQDGYSVEINHLDDSGTFTYDETGNSDMPMLDFGFDTTDVDNWTFAKGYSSIRRYKTITNNTFRNLKFDADWQFTDQFRFSTGFSGRIYDFNTAYYARVVRDTIDPSFEEGGVTTADMTRTVHWGTGLDVPAGTTTAFLAPDIDKYKKVFGIDCNCVNDYGDWTISNKYISISTGNAGKTYAVSEHDKATYAQLSFQDITILGGEFRGNIGLRYAITDTQSRGFSLGGDKISSKNSYNDILPSLNLSYAPTDEMMVRFGISKVMSRPNLAGLAPSVTSMSVPSDAETYTGGSLAIGNPNLKPYRANTVDVSYEWYFDKGSMLSVAAFAKYVSSNPQRLVRSGKLSNFLTEEQIAQIAKFYANYAATTSTSDDNIYSHLINDDVTYDVTQYVNGPGGVLEGIELTYQQQLRFLPAPFDNFGVNLNYTLIKSKMHWILDPSSSTTSDGPWLGASPTTFNATVYYDTKQWSVRTSAAFRSKYASSYPMVTGSGKIGYTDSPTINDFVYTDSSLNLDATFSYTVSEYMQFRIDARNLTNETTRRYAYGKNLYKSPVTTYYGATGRQLFMGVSLKY